MPLDIDWCTACNAYLWREQTGLTPTVGTSAAIIPVATAMATPVMTRAVPPSPVLIGLLDGDDEWLADPTLRLTPGEPLSVRVKVRNQLEVTDTFQVTVDGLPPEWWSVAPARLHLNPYGTSGAYEDEVTVTLRLPRTSAARAGNWRIRFVALVGTPPVEMARTPATVTVGR